MAPDSGHGRAPRTGSPRSQTVDPMHAPNNRASAKARRAALATCFAIVFVSQVLGTLMASPVLRLFEMSACRDYFRVHDPSIIDGDGNVPESLCKVPPVQKEVAFINSLLFSVASGISLGVTIPYGIVADRYGRKIVLGLNLAAEVIFYLLIGMIGYFPDVFPTRAYILTSLLQFMGGGGKVVSAIIYSIIADVSTEEERPRLFYYLEVVDYGTQLVVPAIVSVIMPLSIWIPFIAGVAASTASFIAVLFLPETVAKKAQKRKQGGSNLWEEEALIRNSEGEIETDLNELPSPELRSHRPESPLESETETRPQQHEASKSSFSKLKAKSESISRTILPFNKLKADCKTACIVLFIALALWSVAWTSHLFFQLYASQRFGITLAQSGLIMSYKSFIDVLLFLIILPRFRRFLTEQKRATDQSRNEQSSLTSKSSRTKPGVDMTILRFSAVALALGFLACGLAGDAWFFLFGITIAALGDGFNVTTQAIIITLAEPTAVGQICSWFAFVTTAGRTLGRLIMMECFRKGADEVGTGLLRGLPFDVAGILCAFMAVVLYIPLRLPWRTSEEDLDDRQEDLHEQTA